MTATPGDGLSEEQLAQYKALGYLVLRQVFSADELAVIRREFDYMMEQQYGDSYDGSRRHWTRLMDEETPFYASLLEDPRFLTIARQFHGEDVLGMGTDANRYTGDTGWHRDTSTVHQYGVKFAFYLQPVDADSGALRVIPCTHWIGDDTGFEEAIHRLSGPEIPCDVLASQPGDVVAFDLRLWHAAYGGSSDRHMSTVLYYANPATPEEETALAGQATVNTEYVFKTFEPKRRYLYSKSWVANPHGSPVRQAWIDRLLELHYLDAPGMTES